MRKLLAFFLFFLLSAAGVLAQNINSISPTSVAMTTTGFNLLVTGSGFTGGSFVSWNGINLITTFISSSQLSAAVPDNLLTQPRGVQITVSTGGGTSNSVVFTVLSSVAVVTSYSPTVFTAGQGFFLTVYGSGFVTTSKVYFDWNPVTTTFVSSNQLNATVSSGFVTTSGHHLISVINGVPTAPTKVLSASVQTLPFGSQTIGVPTPSPSAVTLTNIGSSTVNISGITYIGPNGGDFSQDGSTTCGATLSASASCDVDIIFNPSQLGAEIGFLSVASDAVGSPLSVNLTGTGTPTASVSISIEPSLFQFGMVPQSVASSPLTVTLTNTGAPNYVISSIVRAGADVSDFAETGSCTPATYTTSQQCTFIDVFTPSNIAAEVGTITVTDNAPGSPRVISLNGTGTTPGPTFNPNPTAMAFGTITQSTPSAPVTSSVTNSGNTNLVITAETVVGANAADFVLSSTACITTVVPGGSCPATVVFTPSGTTTESAAIQLTDNAVGSPHFIQLSGQGAASGGAHHMDLTWTASTSSGLIGYKVYRGSASGGPYTLLTPTPVNAVSYIDNTVVSGQTYFYVVTAVGPNPPYSPAESVNSTQASGTIP